MSETTQFRIGAQARCTDGACGEVRRVVVDPVARSVTHLVVEPADHLELARLVPLELVSASAEEVAIGCTKAEFARLGAAEETQFAAGVQGYGPYGPEQVRSWPYYGLGPGMAGFGPEMVSPGVTYDTVPLGEVEVRRGEPVQATDGYIGRVQGLVIERKSHHVTHVLLQEGHLWGKKDVAIPIRAVTGVDADEGIRLNITKQQVQDLPPADIEQPGW